GSTPGRSAARCPVPRRLFFFQAEDGIRDRNVTGVQTCALPISRMYSTRILSPGFIRVLYILGIVIILVNAVVMTFGSMIGLSGEIGRASCRERVWGREHGGGACRRAGGP